MSEFTTAWYEAQLAKRARKIAPPPLSFHSLPDAPKKRLRQSATTGLNKLESEFKAILEREWGKEMVLSQSMRLVIANGTTYTPDFACVPHPGDNVPALWFYEVKGFMRDDAAVKLKVAAHQFPMFRFWLVWKERETWKRQEVLG